MEEKYKILIFLGPQGSGKGTQAKFLVDKFGYKFIGAGDSLREIAREDSELGLKVKRTIDGGNLAEADLITEVIKRQLLKLGKNEPVIMEGYPRSLGQFKHFKRLLKDAGRADYLTVYFDITEEETLKRLLLRAEKEGRVDDNEEAIKKRLKWSRQEVDPVVSKMEEENKVIRIDGMPSIEEIHSEVLQKLNLSISSDASED